MKILVKLSGACAIALCALSSVLSTAEAEVTFRPNAVSTDSISVYSSPQGGTKIGTISEDENLSVSRSYNGMYSVSYRVRNGTKSGYIWPGAFVESAWQWPVEDMAVSHEFLQPSVQGRGHHLAIDMTHASIWDPTIRAAARGKVRYRGGCGKGNGEHVILEHYVGWGKTGYLYTLYSHLDSINSGVKLGVTLDKGTPLGIIGNTGTEGVHLHFSVYDTFQSDGNCSSPSGWTWSKPYEPDGNRSATMEGVTYYNPRLVIQNSAKQAP
jgi:murein DD-endopeptidase MepM/ murein hydrolase activator NlpD